MKKAVLVNGKEWTKEDIKRAIQTNDVAVCQALVRIYDHQTSDEQNAATTKYNNGIGFNGCDAEILSSFAKQYKERKSLSAKQIAIARRKVVKYAGQILTWMAKEYQNNSNPRMKAA